MTSCKKCGSRNIGLPRYDKPSDRLVYTCECGYQESRVPLDYNRNAEVITAAMKESAS